MDAIAAEVASGVRTQYSIAYRSTKSPTLGGYRRVHVDAKAKGFSRLQVRTRTGDYPRVASAEKPAAPESGGNTVARAYAVALQFASGT